MHPSRWPAAALSVALAACVSAPHSPTAPPAGGAVSSGLGPHCTAFAGALDAAVDRAAVRDAQDARIASAPWLRIDRFEASFADEPLDAAALSAWLERLRDRDARARRIELANLPEATLRTLAAAWTADASDPVRAASPAAVRQGPTDAAQGVSTVAAGRAALEADLLAGIERCGRTATAASRDDPTALAALRATARVPDDYADWQRALGLYPLTALPFAAGVRREEAAMAAAFAASAGGIARGTRQVVPARVAPPRSADDRTPVRSPGRDPLGVPILAAGQRDALLAAHAPVIALAGRGPDDRFGAIAAAAVGPATVDTSQPAVYGRIAFTRWQHSVRVQLVYTMWFPARPATGALDLLAGHLDGVMIRLTLDDAGRVAMIDSIHACGCWHLFVPVGAWAVRPPPAPLDEWAFVPARVDTVAPGHRVRVRLAARTHAVEGIDTVPADAPGDGVAYRLLDDNDLRSLPTPAGARRSLYDPRGRVPGTERPERWLFWPMGIADAGSMRQWGRHATAFVGRRHFDDPALLERRFTLSPGTASATTPGATAGPPP